MEQFEVPNRGEVSVEDQAIFDKLSDTLGKVPNVYAAFARTENGLGSYVSFQNRQSSLTDREREAINLVVSQVNHCMYCLSQHTVLAKRRGFIDQQILEIRSAEISFDNKLDALVKLAHNIALTKGLIEDKILQDFYEMGYDQTNLVDVVLAVGDKTIMNMMYASTKVPIDWPLATSINASENKD